MPPPSSGLWQSIFLSLWRLITIPLERYGAHVYLDQIWDILYQSYFPSECDASETKVFSREGGWHFLTTTDCIESCKSAWKKQPSTLPTKNFGLQGVMPKLDASLGPSKVRTFSKCPVWHLLIPSLRSHSRHTCIHENTSNFECTRHTALRIKKFNFHLSNIGTKT